MMISGHRCEGSLRNWIVLPSSEQLKTCSDILFKALKVRPHRSQKPSFSALSPRVFLRIRLSFIRKTHVLRLVFLLTGNKTCVFLWATIRPGFVEHFAFGLWIKTKKTKSKSIDFDFPNYYRLWTLMVRKPWWFDILTALVLFSRSDVFEQFLQGFWLAYLSAFYESIKHAVVRVEFDCTLFCYKARKPHLYGPGYPKQPFPRDNFTERLYEI